MFRPRRGKPRLCVAVLHEFLRGNNAWKSQETKTIKISPFAPHVSVISGACPPPFRCSIAPSRASSCATDVDGSPAAERQRALFSWLPRSHLPGPPQALQRLRNGSCAHESFTGWIADSAVLAASLTILRTSEAIVSLFSLVNRTEGGARPSLLALALPTRRQHVGSRPSPAGAVR